MAAWYNENDPKTAAWLRELIKAKLIADGEVDTRSIVDVRPADLAGFTQCHFFAGIGGWSYALRLAGWPDEREVWTGSCPCQPFSSAGTQAGGDDPRHLWPAWFRLIRECRPVVIFGEQVESAIGHGWIDLVHDDMEGEGYAVGPVGVPSAGVGAFDVRHRLWFVADANGGESCDVGLQRSWRHLQLAEDAAARFLADAKSSGRRADVGAIRSSARTWLPGAQGQEQRGAIGEAGRSSRCRPIGELAHASGGGFGIDRSAPRQARHVDEREQVGSVGDAASNRCERSRLTEHDDIEGASGLQPNRPSARGFWDRADWIECRDGKWRAVEPGTFPLAHGIPGRMVKLRGYGNSINPYVAAEVIAAYMEICE